MATDEIVSAIESLRGDCEMATNKIVAAMESLESAVSLSNDLLSQINLTLMTK